MSDMSRMLSVRLDEGLYDTLVEQAEADGRSLSNYVTRLLAEAQRLQEGHSTLGSKPGSRPGSTPRSSPGRPAPQSMRSKATKRAVPRDTAHDRLEAQKILDRVLKAPKPRTAEPAQDGGEDGGEDDGEYFKRIQRENAQKAKGVGPEEWPS